MGAGRLDVKRKEQSKLNQKDMKSRFRHLCGNLAVVLPAVGIIALGGCIRSVCGSWAEMMSVGIFPESRTVQAAGSLPAMAPAAEGTATARVLSPEGSVELLSAGISDNATVSGCGLYIDGQFYGAYASGDSLRGILESIQSLYATGAEGEEVAFTREVQLVDGTYPASDMLTYSGLEAVLSSTVTEEVEYLVHTGDTLSAIAGYYGMTADEFSALNPDFPETIYAGDIMTLNVRQPLLQVQCTRQVNETVSIPFTTVIEGTSASGRAEIVSKGQNGSKQVSAVVVTVNGQETERVVLSEEVITEPVPQVMTEGTMDEVTYSASYFGDTGSGELTEALIWPLPDGGGVETCQYSEDGHQGLDLAIDAGTEIYAAASGKVVVAGTFYTYGNCVVIDHGNGVRTLYGHCSALNVSVVDVATQGDVIGYVGMTGYATGNHLHFELHINNRTHDPLNYVAR